MQAIEVDIQSMDNFTIGRAPYREQIDDSATTMTSGRFVASVEDMERVHPKVVLPTATCLWTEELRIKRSILIDPSFIDPSF
jgi:hypothetical protein